MKITAQHRYQADVDSVFALFSDPDFYVQKFTAVGGRNIEVLDFVANGPELQFKIRRDMPANAPSVIKSIIGEWNTLLQQENWGGEPGSEYWNEFDIEARGTPVTIKGTMNLRADGAGSVNEIEIGIRCPIPLIGGKVEKFVAEDSEKSLAAEHEFVAARLAGG